MWRHHGNDKDGGNIIIVQPANVTETERAVKATLQHSVFYQQRRLLTMIPLQRMLQRMRRSRLVVAHAPVGSWRVQVASTHAKSGSGAAPAAADSFQIQFKYSTVQYSINASDKGAGLLNCFAVVVVLYSTVQQ